MKKKTKPRKPRGIDLFTNGFAYVHLMFGEKRVRIEIDTEDIKEAKKLHKFLEQYIKWRGRR